jgi:hypothetical protein
MIIFPNVVSNKITDFQFYNFFFGGGSNLIIIYIMKYVLGYEKKKILLVRY